MEVSNVLTFSDRENVWGAWLCWLHSFAFLILTLTLFPNAAIKQKHDAKPHCFFLLNRVTIAWLCASLKMHLSKFAIAYIGTQKLIDSSKYFPSGQLQPSAQSLSQVSTREREEQECSQKEEHGWYSIPLLHTNAMEIHQIAGISEILYKI